MAWPGCRFPGRYRKPRYRGFLQIRLPEVLDHFSFSVPPQVRTSIRILILVHNISNMNIQDCRDLVSKFVSSTFDGWPLPRRCGPRFVIPISKTFISIYLSICVFGAGSV